MTRKQTIHAPELYNSAEHLLFCLDVAQGNTSDKFVRDAAERLRKLIEAAKEPYNANAAYGKGLFSFNQ